MTTEHHVLLLFQYHNVLDQELDSFQEENVMNIYFVMKDPYPDNGHVHGDGILMKFMENVQKIFMEIA